jgi:16S rRNA (guanine(966)-N(2))-methyltransferase RsmD
MKRTHRTQIRIIAGNLRGRRISCTVSEQLRPTPDMVREALFSILGDAIPDRPFYDVFAGTGVIGMEAISRGAQSATFLERDFRLAQDIEQYLQDFGVSVKGQVLRADVYRWAERWQPVVGTPVNLFLSPPFHDLEQSRLQSFMSLVATLQEKLPPGSILVVQAELGFPVPQLPGTDWEERHYGRNLLLLWIAGARSANA